MPTSLTQNDQIWLGNTYEEGGVFLGGQPRHCVCTNVWCGLSAIAKFLVLQASFFHTRNGVEFIGNKSRPTNNRLY